MPTVLTTERVRLRRLTAADVDRLAELNSDPAVMRYLTGGKPTSRERIERELLPGYLAEYDRFNGLGHWAAEELAGGGFIGWFALTPNNGDSSDVELGYRLRRAAWNRGYASEVSKALVAEAFNRFGAQRVYAETMAVNTGSRRVMAKAGLRFVRNFREHFDDPIPGSEHGEVEYALSRREWESLSGRVRH